MATGNVHKTLVKIGRLRLVCELCEQTDKQMKTDKGHSLLFTVLRNSNKNQLTSALNALIKII